MGIRYTQPQENPRINWANPITRSLAAVISARSGQNMLYPVAQNGLSGAGIAPTPSYGLAADFIGKASTSKVTTNFLLTSPNSTTPGDRTYFMPFLRNGNGGGSFGRFFQKGSNECYLMEDVGTNTFVFVQSTSGGGNLSTQRFPPLGGLSGTVGWHTIAVTITAGGTVKMYLDGVSQGLTASSYSNGATTQTSAYVLGNRSTDNARVWNGQLGDLLIFDRVATDDEILSLHNNQNHIYKPTARRLWVGAAGGTNTAVNPGTGSIAITGYAPSIAQTANQAVAPDVGNIVITGYAPTISQPRAVNPGVGSLTITGYAPTVTQNVDTPVNPGVGTIAITGYAPAVSQTANQLITPDVGNIAITGYSPTVSQSANQAVTPDVGTITITGYAPIVQQAPASQNITPDVGTITITGYAPTVEQSSPLRLGGFEYGSKVYIKRNKKIYIFDSVEEADSYLEAEAKVEEIVQQSNRTSRLARKRAREKAFKSLAIEPVDTVDIPALKTLVAQLQTDFELPKLIAQQDWQRVVEIYNQAMEMQDEEDLLLIL